MNLAVIVSTDCPAIISSLESVQMSGFIILYFLKRNQNETKPTQNETKAKWKRNETEPTVVCETKQDHQIEKSPKMIFHLVHGTNFQFGSNWVDIPS